MVALAKRPRLWFIVVIVASSVAAAALTAFFLSEGRAKSDQWASIISVFVAVLVAVVSLLLWLWRRGGDDATDERVQDAVDALAWVQSEQWGTERAARSIHDPWLLPVRWTVTKRSRTMMTSWAAARGRPGAGPVSFDGTLDRIADVFEGHHSPRRLVVVGDAGSGKSIVALELTLQLLERRRPGQPVPVLLPVAGWDPQLDLDDWVAGQLALLSRRLGRLVTSATGQRRTLARELAARGLVLPILDGLDELPRDRQAAALNGIAAARGGVARRFVLTSRTTEYEIAVRAAGRRPTAPVVELLPLAAFDVARYLEEGSAHDPGRWTRVRARLTAKAPSPPAEALSTPLMASLALVLYRGAHTDPDELVDAGWAATADGIRQHLLTGLIPTVYTSAIGGHPRRSPALTAAAGDALTLLARHLADQKTYQLTWWQLHLAVPPRTLRAARWAVAASSLAVAFGLAMGPQYAVITAVLSIFLLREPPVERPERFSPRGIPLRGVAVGLLLATAGGGLMGYAAGAVTGVLCGAAIGVSFVFGSHAFAPFQDDDPATSPRELLVADRRQTLAAVAAFAPAAAIAAWIWMDVPRALAIGFAVALAIVMRSAWGTLNLARIMLRAAGPMPLSLMGFLDEARNRGVLRQSGALYQFRHAALQEHLARRGRPPVAAAT
ncbi:NACHT domain-containing protein [Paractinoplanes atraurantiacus]|uniref:NACHT domain-containing protein n=1 Tax=Paractinoplanes atraurantiacus TaxID=1036182 RepID=A0A285JXL1_9ACTN|nr:NACHT domain-containing protein [Actinoplanes atraurantiacus]SNY65055.1 NACHT domain-containing protein [Actinoplanes atraurantiacus]